MCWERDKVVVKVHPRWYSCQTWESIGACIEGTGETWSTWGDIALCPWEELTQTGAAAVKHCCSNLPYSWRLKACLGLDCRSSRIALSSACTSSALLWRCYNRKCVNLCKGGFGCVFLSAVRLSPCKRADGLSWCCSVWDHPCIPGEERLEGGLFQCLATEERRCCFGRSQQFIQTCPVWKRRYRQWLGQQLGFRMTQWERWDTWFVG